MKRLNQPKKNYMQNKFYAIAALALLLSLSSEHANAQIVGANCFLKGNYVEVGINTCGAYGTPTMPPAGYHPTESGLGFVADWESDGWDAGTPDYCGDYFVPGSPVEGWQIQIGDDWWTNTDQGCFGSDIPGDVSDYTYAAGIYTGVWTGTLTAAGGIDLGITQITTLPEDELYFVTRILLCNNGDEPLEDVYYKRNVDPDNDQPWSGDFTTDNEIVYQPPTDPEALVTSEGLTYGCFLGIGARDENARVSWGNFGTDDGSPQAVWEATGGYTGAGSSVGDIANSISFYIPIINPGECKCVAFAYILNVDDLEEALEATVTYNLTADDVTVSSGDTVYVCEPGEPVTLSILGADDYTWTWTPSDGLDVDTGTSVVATVSETTTYTITGVGGFCGDATLEVTIVVDETELADAGDDVAICLGDATVLSGDGGVAEDLFLWSPAAGLGCTDCPSPSASPTEPGEYTYTLTTTNIYGCDATDEVVVTVYALPEVNAGTDVDLCPEGAVDLEATGAVEYTWSPSTGLSCDDCPDPTCTVDETTTYTVTGVDANGCVNTDVIEVNVFPNLEGIMTVETDESVLGVYGFDLIEIDTIDIYMDESVVINAEGAVEYSWTPANGLDQTNIEDPTAQPDQTTLYVVTGVDANGCVDVDSILIVVIGEIDVQIPTAFSPNGDNINDTWYPLVTGSGCIDGYTIYNRYGEVVFEGPSICPDFPCLANDTNCGWNGTFNGEAQGIGTFVVVIKFSTTDGIDKMWSGHFTLVK